MNIRHLTFYNPTLKLAICFFQVFLPASPPSWLRRAQLYVFPWPFSVLLCPCSRPQWRVAPRRRPGCGSDRWDGGDGLVLPSWRSGSAWCKGYCVHLEGGEGLWGQQAHPVGPQDVLARRLLVTPGATRGGPPSRPACDPGAGG